jgi:hypothetical protein
MVIELIVLSLGELHHECNHVTVVLEEVHKTLMHFCTILHSSFWFEKE